MIFLKLIFVSFVDEERVVRSEGGGSETGSSVFSRMEHLDRRYLLVLRSASRGSKVRTQLLSLLQESVECCGSSASRLVQKSSRRF